MKAPLAHNPDHVQMISAILEGDRTLRRRCTHNDDEDVNDEQDNEDNLVV